MTSNNQNLFHSYVSFSFYYSFNMFSDSRFNGECFYENEGKHNLAERVLNGSGTQGDMTPQKCTSLCLDQGFAYAGVQNGNQCFCGNDRPLNPAPAGDCKKKCDGDSSQKCGAAWRMNVFSTNKGSSTLQWM